MTAEHSAGRRPQSAALTVLGLLIPGVARVHAQVQPFADAWQAANAAELRREGPMIVPRRRAAVVPAFASLIAELPAVPTVIAALPRRNPQAAAINALIDAAASAGRLRAAQMRRGPLRSLRGTLSEDHFHPNERGYAAITAAFAAALGLAEPTFQLAWLLGMALGSKLSNRAP